MSIDFSPVSNYKLHFFTGQVYPSKNKKNNSENVLFTITKHQEQEETSQQPDNDQSASYLVRFENEEPVSQEPQVTHHPLVVGKTKLPGSMQLLMPAKSSAAQQQPRLEAGQIMTLRRPDGTLVQVVAQRSRQQQQQILAPRHPGQVSPFSSKLALHSLHVFFYWF